MAPQGLKTVFWSSENWAYNAQTVSNTLYTSIVRSHLECAVAVCSPSYKKDMIAHVIENVQRRATKLISSIRQLSYQEWLNQRPMGHNAHLNVQL